MKAGRFRKTTLAAMGFGLCWSLKAATFNYYVDVKAPDGGNGTANSPWRTLSGALAAVNATNGDHTFNVFIGSGVYADVHNGGQEDFSIGENYTLTTEAATGSQPTARVTNFRGGYAGYTGGACDWTTRTLRASVVDCLGSGARALTVLNKNSILLEGLVFRNGNAAGDGGAVYVNTPGTGGNYGQVDVQKCAFSNNVASGKGGALYIANMGQAIYTWRTNEFRNNRAAEGGALRYANQANRALNFEDCLFIGNQAVSGNGGAMLLGEASYGIGNWLRCLFLDNACAGNGGVVYRQPFGNPDTLSFTRCAFQRNSAGTNGSVVYTAKFGTQVFANCLIVSNTAAASPSPGFTLCVAAGAGGSYPGTMYVRHCTIADNVGGGIYAQCSAAGRDADLEVNNCIVVNNGAIGVQSDDPAPVVDYNDVYGHTTSNYSGLAAGVHDISVDPQFIALQGNGFMLQRTSPCLDAAPDIGVATDLLGAVRPLRNGFDMGAYEESFLPSVTNLPPVVGADKAILRGQLLFDGLTNCQVDIYWGTSDGGTTATAWGTNTLIGSMRTGVVETLVSGLIPGQTYFYRCHASNWYEEAWASTSEGFTALSAVHTAVWTGASTSNNFASNPTNWSGMIAPTRLSVIALDGSATRNMLWDSNAVTEVWAWDQQSTYTGTVTVGTVYSGAGQGAFTNFHIYADCAINGGAWKHQSNTGNANRRWYRLCTTVGGNFTLGAAAAIACNAIGYRDQSGPGYPGCHGGQVGHDYDNALPVQTYGEIKAPIELGSGGNWGNQNFAHGGGAVQLFVVSNAAIDGVVNVLPADEASGTPQGAGGSIYLRCGSLSGTGVLDASALQVSALQPGVSKQGGGGRIAVIVTNGTSFGAVALRAYGGPSQPGAAGTIYTESLAHAPGYGVLLIDNNNANSPKLGQPYFAYGVTLMPQASAYNAPVNLHDFAQVIVTNRGILGVNVDTTLNLGTAPIRWAGRDQSFLAIRGTNGLTFPNPFVVSNFTLLVDTNLSATGDWTVTAQGRIAASVQRSNNTPNSDTSGTPLQNPLTLTLTGNLTVDAGAAITMVGAGHACGGGLGRALTRAASHGGWGGYTNLLPAGRTYGSITNPLTPGSGGFWGTDNTAEGGGVIRLTVSGATTVNGGILATGLVTDSEAGGSIYLRTDTLSGTGSIDASGFSGGNYGGGGGRVAVYLTGGTSPGGVALKACGGDAGQDGAAGTVYLETAAQPPGYGTVLIDNNGLAGATNSVTPLPATTNGVASEIEHAMLVVTNLARVLITTNLTVRDLRLAAGTHLDLNGQTLTVGSAPHALDGAVFTNNGAIIWRPGTRGTVILLR